MLKTTIPLFRIEPGQRVFLLKRWDSETKILSVIGPATCEKYIKAKLTFDVAFNCFLEQHHSLIGDNPLYKKHLEGIFRNTFQREPLMYTQVFKTDDGRTLYGIQASYVPLDHYDEFLKRLDGATVIETQFDTITLEILEDDICYCPDGDDYNPLTNSVD